MLCCWGCWRWNEETPLLLYLTFFIRTCSSTLLVPSVNRYQLIGLSVPKLQVLTESDRFVRSSKSCRCQFMIPAVSQITVAEGVWPYRLFVRRSMSIHWFARFSNYSCGGSLAVSFVRPSIDVSPFACPLQNCNSERRLDLAVHSNLFLRSHVDGTWARIKILDRRNHVSQRKRRKRGKRIAASHFFRCNRPGQLWNVHN